MAMISPTIVLLFFSIKQEIWVNSSSPIILKYKPLKTTRPKHTPYIRKSIKNIYLVKKIKQMLGGQIRHLHLSNTSRPYHIVSKWNEEYNSKLRHTKNEGISINISKVRTKKITFLLLIELFRSMGRFITSDITQREMLHSSWNTEITIVFLSLTRFVDFYTNKV